MAKGTTRGAASSTSSPAPTNLLSVSGSVVAQLHTALSACAFLLAFGVGSWLHYKKIVQNEHWGYPDEWFPSVSSTIGDWYPERNLFQIVIALTSGPRLLLILLLHLVHTSSTTTSNTTLPNLVSASGLIRTLSCAGWVFITSGNGDDALVHDAAMILYMVMNIPWMIGGIVLTQEEKKYRTIVTVAFFSTIGPLIFFYLRHKSERLAGAYTHYSFFEWSLIILDVLYDSLSIGELSSVQVQVVLDEREVVAAASKEVTISKEKEAAPQVAPPVQVEGFIPNLDQLTAGWRVYLAEIYLAFVFWSNLTALGPMIFYQSVWSMGLSGDEIVLFAVLSPFLLGSPTSAVYRFCIKYPVVAHLATIGGIAAYKIDDEGWLRLRAFGVIGAMMTLSVVTEWWEAHRKDGSEGVKSKATIFTLGLLLSVLAKFANHSINPVWPFMADNRGGHMPTGGWNGYGLLIASWAVWELWYNRNSLDKLLANAPLPAAPVEPEATSVINSTLSSAAFGATFFLLHFLFSDAGTIIAWSWTGYPATGPSAMPHGVFTILAITLGVLLSTSSRSTSIASHPFFLILACAASYALYVLKDWPAFAAGLYLALYAFTLFPAILDSAIRNTSRPSWFGLGFLVYCILELASVWTVAYAFVPGGWAMRERTGVVLAGIWISIAGGILVLWRARPSVDPAGPRPTPLRSYRLRTVLATILFLAVGVVWYRQPLAPPVPFHADERIMTACIWTMHFGLDGRMWESQRRMRDIIRDAEIDVIGLLESDLQRIVMGNRDMTQVIAHDLGYYADIGPSPSSHTWGAALLSKFPILNSTHHLLPSPNGELAPAIHATLDVYGELVDVVVAHNGQEEDPVDRELQSRELARLMREAQPRPVIFLGYVVTKPHEKKPAPYQILVEEGQVLDVDPADDDRWCEYILYRGLYRIGYARLNRGSNPAITDTELQLAKFVVPTKLDLAAEAAKKKKKKQKPFTLDVSNNRVASRLIKPELRFPDKFYGDGVRGHRYQVLKDEHGFAPMYYMDEEKEEKRQLELLESIDPENCTQS